MKQFNKLIRDKIPEILDDKGLDYKTIIIDEDLEFFQCLIDKLHEEVQEFTQEPTLEEFCDIWLVMDTIMESQNYKLVDVYDEMIRKLKDRGGFNKRIFLKWIDK